MTDAPATQTLSPAAGSHLTDDAFLGSALHILQQRSGYRAGLDAVMLAATVPASDNRPQRVLDLGAGVGTAGLCVARRIETAEVVLLERDPQLATLAEENVRRNNLSHRVRVVTLSVGAPAAEVRAAGLIEESFTHVIANPPYHDTGSGTLAPDATKAAAHAMPDDELDSWARFMARMAAPRGLATIVHKADAMQRVLAALDPRFGGIKIMPLYPRPGDNAHRVIVEGMKGSRAPLQLLSGLVLHSEGNDFTPTAQAILRAGASLPLPGARR
ncbi:tRNA1Val (adenine37-N6)-methyltransferase [Hyphomicrobium sp. 1Nfss2.1]|uniref:tRNA1(Val) (adenine(37)-N6)-methyltransferase n=1 Tax=Hyphomicrobium sp. 1Nfss2.1 TaxID=3413936 RepID=UPI003C7D438A